MLLLSVDHFFYKSNLFKHLCIKLELESFRMKGLVIIIMAVLLLLIKPRKRLVCVFESWSRNKK